VVVSIAGEPIRRLALWKAIMLRESALVNQLKRYCVDIQNFVHFRRSLFGNCHWSWRLFGDTLRLRAGPYKATAKQSGLSLELLSGRGEWFTFFENLIREDYLHGLAPLCPGDHVIDVGANIGAFTVLAASKVAPDGHVYAFEPDPEVCERLRQNLRINELRNVTVYEAAVAAESGEAIFHRYAKNAFSSLHDGVDGRVQGHTSSFPVNVVGIRDVIDMVEAPDGVCILKLDCEGSEYDIFDAMDPEHAARIRQLAMEVHPLANKSRDSLIARLRALGFDMQIHAHLLAGIRDGARPAE
jgi:FkbM family methyltransferase